MQEDFSPIESVIKETTPPPRRDGIDIAVEKQRLHVAEWAVGTAAVIGADVFGRDYGSNLLALDAVASGSLAGMATGIAITAFNLLGAGPIHRKRAANVTRQQQTLREALNESVDLFSASKKKGGPVLRWYAPDALSEDSEPSDYADRLKKLVDYMEESGIPRIAFSNRLVGTADISNVTSSTGLTVDGTDPVKYLKGRSHDPLAPVINDQRLDKEMRICSIQEARTIAEVLRSQQNDTRLARLIAHTHNPGVMRAFELFLADKIPKLQVYNTVQRVLTEQLSNDMDLSFITDKSNPSLRGVNITDYTLRGNVLITTQTPRLRDGVIRESMGSGFTSIFHHLGIRSKEELYDRIFSGTREPGQQEVDALWCAYMYLQEEEVHEEETRTDASSESQFAGNHTMPPTTMQLLEQKQKNSHDTSIKYEYRRRRLLGTVAAGVALTAVVSGSVQFGLTALWYKEDATLQHACDATAKQWTTTHPGSLTPYTAGFTGTYYCDEQLTADTLAQYPGLRIPNAFDNAMGYLALTVQANVLAKTGDMLLGAGLALPQDMNQWMPSDNNLANHIISHMTKLPPNQATGEYNGPAVGDTAVNVKEAQYAITPLTGKTPAGYWYEGVNYYLSSTDGLHDFPEYRALDSDVTTKHIKLPSATNEILATKPDFSVDALAYDPQSYYGPNLMVALPILKGYSLVGAQLVDSKNPSRETAIDIIHTPSQQSYAAYITNDMNTQFEAMGGGNGVIRYYIKESQGSTPKALKPFVIDNVDSKNSSSAYKAYTQIPVPQSVSTSIKEILGLSATATNRQIDEAIRKKRYSYTPFSDTHTNIPSDKNVDPLLYYKKFGSILAEMAEMNCNVASTTALLAQNPAEEKLNEAFGYRIGSDKGILTNLDAHQWNVNGNGTIEDATPGTFAPNATMPPDQISNAVPASAPHIPADLPAVTGGLGLAGVLLTKRKKLSEATKNIYYSLTMGNRHTDAALQVAEVVRYAAPGSRVTPMKHERPSIALLETLIGEDARTLRTYAHERGIDITNIPRGVWRQLNRLHAARKIITGRYQ